MPRDSKPLRYRFWRVVHDALEKLWHWSYYHGLLPATPPIMRRPNINLLFMARPAPEEDKARSAK